MTAEARKHFQDLRKKVSLPSKVDAKAIECINNDYYGLGIHKRVCMAYMLFLNPSFPTETICTVFKITRKGTTSNYAYLYSVWDKDDLQFHDYFLCVGGALTSCDGEYRKNYLFMEDYYTITKTKLFEPILELAEDLVSELMNDEKIEVRADMYYPKFINFIPKKFEDHINNHRWAIKLLALCWLYYFKSIHELSIENHINPAFQYIFYQKKMRPIYDKITKSDKLSKAYNNLYELLETGSNYETGVEISIMGQKLYPVSNEDILSAASHNISSTIWREFYFTSICSQLSFNYAAPNFSYLRFNSFIQNVHAGIFDNNSQFIKYAQSKLGEELRNLLAEKDKKTYEYLDEEANIKKYLSPNFKELSALLKQAKQYSDKYIVLTDLVVCMVTPNDGRTFKDLPGLTKSTNPLFKSYRNLFLDVELFRTQMFTLVYGLLAMNKKGGIIHADLHQNNFIFNYNNYIEDIDKPMYNIFSIDSSTNYYVKYEGFTAMIIDFSRSLFYNYDIIKNEFGSLEAEKMKHTQKKQIIKLLHRVFPDNFDLKDHKYINTIKSIIDNDYSNFFKVLTLIDTYFCCLNIQNVLKVQSEITVHSDIIDLVDKILKDARSLFFSNLQKLIDIETQRVNERTTSARSPKFPWFNDVLLDKLFDDYRDDTKLGDDYLIIDIYNIDNKLAYNISEQGDEIVPNYLKSKVEGSDEKYEETSKIKKSFSKDMQKLIDVYSNKIEKDEITIF